MFTRSAEIYDLIYSFKDYEAASARLVETIRERNPGARSVLDVACGTGRHLEYLRLEFEVSGVDVNADLLTIARRRCPDVPFHVADMTNFDLAERFDVVTCLFSSIAYTRTRGRMVEAIRAMADHLNANGLLIIEPFFGPDRFWDNHLTTNVAKEEGRHVVWMYVQRRVGDQAVLDIHYMVGTRDGIERFEERHELGLFWDNDVRQALIHCGLAVEYDADGLFGRGMFIGHSAP